MSINRVTISGNLTRDAVLRQTNGSGLAVVNFSVAVNDRRKNSETGEWEDVPNYVECSMFGKRAESIQKYLTKGTKVAVEGKLRYSSWNDKNNPEIKRSSLSVLVDEIEFMSRNNAAGVDAGSAAPVEEVSQVEPEADDDVPF